MEDRQGRELKTDWHAGLASRVSAELLITSLFELRALVVLLPDAALRTATNSTLLLIGSGL